MGRRISSKPKPKALVFAGTGETSEANVTALMNDFIGWSDADDIPEDDETLIYFPLTKEQASASGMNAMLNWVDEMEAAYEVFHNGETSAKVRRFLENAEDGGTEVDNPHMEAITNLVDLRKTHDVFLVLLWDDNDEDAEMILDLAIANDIPAVDLTAGLDKIEFDDEEEDAEPAEERERAAPEPEEEPDEPKALKVEEKALSADSGDMHAEVANQSLSFSKKALDILDKAKVAEPDIVALEEPEVEVDEPLTYDEIVSEFDLLIKHVDGYLRTVASIQGGDQAFYRLNEAFFWFKRQPSNSVSPLHEVELEEAVAYHARESEGVEEIAPESETKSRRGRPRTSAKTRTEFWDGEVWVPYTGRGRRPKDVKFRTVNAETGEPV